MASLLIVDENPDARRLLAEEFALEGHTVVAPGGVSLGDACLIDQIVRFSRLDMIVASIPPDEDRRWALVRRMKKWNPALPILLLSRSKADPQAASYAGNLAGALLHSLAQPERHESRIPH
ncbi:MAG TPA: hypothetical protein VLS90_10405 [Thermodesulfobacteriota bacterium]|nr:hypothetical protein [Thermodesulfobacteriota bacterium]